MHLSLLVLSTKREGERVRAASTVTSKLLIKK